MRNSRRGRQADAHSEIDRGLTPLQRYHNMKAREWMMRHDAEKRRLSVLSYIREMNNALEFTDGV